MMSVGSYKRSNVRASNQSLIKLSVFLRQNAALIRQFFGYLFVGASAAIVDLGVFALLARWLTLNYLIAVFFSFTTGTLFNFSLCDKFILKREKMNKLVAAARHYLSSIGGLITNMLVMVFLVEIFDFPYLVIVKCIAVVCAFIVNFLFIRSFAFNSKIQLMSILGRE